MNKSVSFIGSGKIVHSFIPALLNSGFEIDTVVGQNHSELEILASEYKIKSCSQNFSSLDEKSYIFLAVPDSEILDVANSIAKLNLDFADTVFIHLSGSKTISELSPLSSKGYIVAGLHPMQTFSSYSAIDLHDVHAAIETTDAKIYSELSELALELKMKPFRIKSEEKTAYHLMGVFVSNFMTANFFNADEIVKKSKSIPDSKDLMQSIARQTLENILNNGPINSLSGPIERGDTVTIKNHLECLKKEPNLLSFYISSSLTLCEMALQKGSISESKHEELKNLLKNFV